MPIDLPEAIADYFAADAAKNAERVAECFAPDAVVKDEGKAHSGREAIRAWKTESSAKYDYTATPLRIVTEGDRMVVTSHLEGNFPGSPVDLRYGFALQGGKISGLEIAL